MKRFLIKFPLTLIKILFYILLYGTPVLGVWGASSIVAYLNGIQWFPVIAGILLFPVLPLLWEWRGYRKRKHQKTPKPRVLTFLDRLTLRTFVMSFLFISGLLAFYPKTAFLALSIRGDWMLPTASSPSTEFIRQSLFNIADRLEWLYLVVSPNPYTKYLAKTEEVQPPQTDGSQSSQTDGTQTQKEQEHPRSKYAFQGWPWKEQSLHPLVTTMPPAIETSIESVAHYIAQHESDPFLRIKALHDYAADRIAYDAESYFAGRYPPQDAAAVFTTRKSVCAGYANLFKALGDAIGEDIQLILGDARRTQDGDLSGEGHAWNTVKIEGNWYLVDVTWDSGYVERNAGFTKRYQTAYLFPPPEIMSITHFPDEQGWQLVATPLTRGDFLRQPMMMPSFFAEGMELVSPTRSQMDVKENAIIEIKNPQQQWIIAKFGIKGSEAADLCTVEREPLTRIECVLPQQATYEIQLFSSPKQYNTEYSFVGRLEFNRQS